MKFSNLCCIQTIYLKPNISLQTYGCSESPQKFCGAKNDDVHITMSMGSNFFLSSAANSVKLRIYNPVKTDCKYM